MTSARFAAQLNEQIGNELAAHNQYLACAIHYDAETMPQMAAFFYAQALEEREHAMMMVQYLLDTDQPVEIPAIPYEELEKLDDEGQVKYVLGIVAESGVQIPGGIIEHQRTFFHDFDRFFPATFTREQRFQCSECTEIRWVKRYNLAPRTDSVVDAAQDVAFELAQLCIQLDRFFFGTLARDSAKFQNPPQRL